LSKTRTNPWTTLDSTLQYDNPWIRVVEHRVLTPRQTPGIYGTVHFKHLATGVLPIDTEGCTYLVGQFRYPLEAYSWEMPEGGGTPGVPLLDSVQRELLEETGLTARHWLELMRLHLSNSVSDEVATCFLAWDLEPGEAQPEDSEQLEVRRLPFAEVAAMVWRGEITDAMSVAAIQRLELLLHRGLAPAPVAAAIGSPDRWQIGSPVA
jgi:8-oxo-dGTP pyrophosphatase MutT (NUDIX family)